MDWSLRKKILLGYGVVLFLTALLLAWDFFNLVHLGRASDAILSENYRSIIAAENMIDALERQDSGVLLYILGFESEGTRQFRESQTQFAQWLGRARDNVTIEGEADLIRTIDSTYAAYLEVFSQITNARDGNVRPVRTEYHDILLPSFSAVRNAGAKLRDLNEATMQSASDRARAVAVRARVSMGFIGLITLGLGLVFSLILSNRLVRPIQKMRDATMLIADGNYDVEIAADTEDELGRLSAQFNEMTARLRAYRDLNVERIMTEQKKSEAVVQSIDDGVVVVGSDLVIENMNPAAARALDTAREVAIGRPLRDVVRNETLFDYLCATVESGVAPAVDEGMSFISVERDGAQQHFQFAITPVHAGTGSSTGAVLLLRDVTKLRELDRLKSEFVATASHELKTPLTSIGMSIGLLQERASEKLSDRERELLVAAGEDVDRLRHLVNDLLDLSKIEAGKIDLDFADVPASLVADRAVMSLKSQADEGGIMLSSSVGQRLSAVHVDANKIIWVLSNLIANALRHTGPGGHIELTAMQAGSKIHFSVRDDGEGIPYAFQSKIFDKFVQAGGRKSVGGSGLGLAISREIVRAHGGSIWVESAPGVGSTFTFSLPTSAPQNPRAT